MFCLVPYYARLMLSTMSNQVESNALYCRHWYSFPTNSSLKSYRSLMWKPFPLIFRRRPLNSFCCLPVFMTCWTMGGPPDGRAVNQLFRFLWTTFAFRMISREPNLLYGKWRSLGFKCLGLSYLELITSILKCMMRLRYTVI